MLFFAIELVVLMSILWVAAFGAFLCIRCGVFGYDPPKWFVQDAPESCGAMERYEFHADPTETVDVDDTQSEPLVRDLFLRGEGPVSK